MSDDQVMRMSAAMEALIQATVDSPPPSRRACTPTVGNASIPPRGARGRVHPPLG